MDKTSQNLHKILNNTTDNTINDNMNNNLESPKSNTSRMNLIFLHCVKKKQVKHNVEHIKIIMKRIRNIY